ncbi:MAG: hypothetical protein ACTHNU_15630 [Gaiellales bacterium]
MRRLATIAVITFAGAAVAHRLWHRDRPVPSEGNGHSSDEERTAALRARIDAVRRRLRDEFDSVRGE